MSELLNSVLVPSAVALVASVVLYAASNRSKKAPLPPGPKPTFLLGNALQMPTEKEWFTYADWGKTWGDVVYVNVFGRPLIILNSYKASVDLMEKRSAIYSGRPVLTMASLAGWSDGVAFTTYNDKCRMYRRILHKAFNQDTVNKNYNVFIENEVLHCLRRFLETPQDFMAHVRRTAAAVVMKVTYGYDLQEGPDPFIKVADEAMEAFSHVSRPGAWVVDFVPILQYIPKWFPGAGFRKIAESLSIHPYRLTELPFQWTKKSMAEGTDVPSFVQKLLEDGDPEQAIKWAAGSLFGGGSDTTVSAINSFILAMSIYPDVQRRGQEEIDRVVGRDRLPSFSDRPNLPYIEAIVREVLRWNPVTPLGVPHAVQADDIYEGFRIPKDSVIIPNIWGIFHDERLYKSPYDFNPDRFMVNQESLPEMDPHNVAFGFGRRICPGFYVARNEVYLAIAQILATFSIKKALDEAGKEIEPPVSFTTGIVNRPEDFKCRIELRYREVATLIRG